MCGIKRHETALKVLPGHKLHQNTRGSQLALGQREHTKNVKSFQVTKCTKIHELTSLKPGLQKKNFPLEF